MDWRAEAERREKEAIEKGLAAGKKIILIDLSDIPPEALKPLPEPVPYAILARQAVADYEKCIALAEREDAKAEKGGSDKAMAGFARRAAQYREEADAYQKKALEYKKKAAGIFENMLPIQAEDSDGE